MTLACRKKVSSSTNACRYFICLCSLSKVYSQNTSHPISTASKLILIPNDCKHAFKRRQKGSFLCLSGFRRNQPLKIHLKNISSSQGKPFRKCWPSQTPSTSSSSRQHELHVPVLVVGPERQAGSSVLQPNQGFQVMDVIEIENGIVSRLWLRSD